MPSLCNLSVLGVSVVTNSFSYNHGDTEDTEVAQRKQKFLHSQQFIPSHSGFPNFTAGE